MVQISPPSGTAWAICALVDSTQINPPCPYQGTLPAVSAYVTGNSQQSFPVSQGTHTVQTQIYVSAASSGANWQTTDEIMKN